MILQKYKQNSISGAFCMFFNVTDGKKGAASAMRCRAFVSCVPYALRRGCYSSVSRGSGFMSYEAIARVNPQ